jgi:NitT/TauT family transport system substrate-binding protein
MDARRALLALLGVVGLWLVGCSGASGPQAPASQAAPPSAGGAAPAPVSSGAVPTPIAVALAYTTTNAATTPMWLAQETGLFREQGLETSLVRIPAGAPLLAALQNADVAVAMAGGPQIVDAVLQGGDQVIVGSLTNYHNQALYSAPAFTTVESLRGHAVGVSRHGASSDVAGREALRRYGLEPGRDVAILPTGGNPESVAALQAGTVQGIVVSPPLGLEAKRLGLNLLIDITALRLPSPGSTLSTTRTYLRAHPDIVERVVKAVIAGVHRYETDPEAAMAAIARYTNVYERDVLEDTYAYYRGRFQRDLYPSLESIAAELQGRVAELPAAAQARPEQFVDLTIVERLRASGYADSLYRGAAPVP